MVFAEWFTKHLVVDHGGSFTIQPLKHHQPPTPCTQHAFYTSGDLVDELYLNMAGTAQY